MLDASPPGGAKATANRFPSLADFDGLDELGSSNDAIGFAASQVAVARRHLDIPLTYDDLAVPLDQPKPLMDRYSATATVQQQKLEQEKIAALVMPPMESLPLTQQQELFRVAETVDAPAASTQSHASGRLASASGTDRAANGTSARLDTLPPPQDAQRQHHWIRQPD